MVERFRIEITLMSNLQHPNVLLFIAAVIDRPAADKATDNIESSKKSTFPKSVREQKQNMTTIALVTEFCEHGRYMTRNFCFPSHILFWMFTILHKKLTFQNHFSFSRFVSTCIACMTLFTVKLK
jgi:hypothetical protein